jgi:hypothetical protein
MYRFGLAVGKLRHDSKIVKEKGNNLGISTENFYLPSPRIRVIPLSKENAKDGKEVRE